MAFEKGHEKKGGRPKGGVNKGTKGIRDAFQLLVESNLVKLEDDLLLLKPAERIKYTIELAKFCLPTLKAVDFKGAIQVTEYPNIKFVKKTE